MRSLVLSLFLACILVAGCATQNSPAEGGSASGGAANAFNPWMNQKLPNTRASSSESQQMLAHLGATAQSIEGEAAHRKHWREEIYPIVFGSRTAPGEIIVLLDFAKTRSAEVWKNVVEASKSINPDTAKIVVFGHSGEPYGTDLMGLAIWISYSRPNQAMPYLTYALDRWNEVKEAQKRAGGAKKFTNEYDATASSTDFPIHYAYFKRLNPPVPASQELGLGKYCFDAGNVNMYQASQIASYYGVKSLPAVLVNGKILNNPEPAAILGALK